MENGFIETPLKYNQERSKWAIVSLQVALGIAITYLVASLFQIYAVNEIMSTENYESILFQYMILLDACIPILTLVILLVTAYLFISWCRRAYGNLHRLGVRNLSHTEDHVPWAFIIPIISLFRPLKIIKEIDLETKKQIAADPEKSYMISYDTTISSWWVVFIASAFLSNIASRIYPEDF
ncbi:MAG: DUF4328 domain-containing protein, partial [Nonlabens sp.]|nr:DUF4328 domain-containing protein [Nonlabens sp.]